MPEGPSIVILKEAVQTFKGKKVVSATGNSKKIDLTIFAGRTILDFKSWGKHFLICFDSFTIRIHFLLFGSYRINEEKDSTPRLRFEFEDGLLNFYGCAVQLIESPLNDIYDWTADVMSPTWDEKKALKKLKQQPDMLVCDALLDQTIFSGVGNIIKNEVLYRIHIHPESTIGKLPKKKILELVTQAVQYSYDFLVWKKEFTLKKHWLAHTKRICSRDQQPIEKLYLGKTNRRTFFCACCQELYH